MNGVPAQVPTMTASCGPLIVTRVMPWWRAFCFASISTWPSICTRSLAYWRKILPVFLSRSQSPFVSTWTVCVLRPTTCLKSSFASTLPTVEHPASGVTAVTTVAALLAGFGSSVEDDAEAVLEMLVVVVLIESVPATVTVTVPPPASVPSGQESRPDAIEQLPAVVVNDGAVRSAGSASLSVTAAAASGPAFVTVSV